MQTDELAAGRLFPVAMLLRLTRGVANVKDVPSFLGCGVAIELCQRELGLKDVARGCCGAAERRFTNRIDDRESKNESRRDRAVTSTGRRDWGAGAAVLDS
jgi:hypothetical protein